MPTIAIDFDGVIHAYSRGWADGSIYDDPMPGAIDGLRALQRSYAIYVHTTRDPKQVVEWLQEHGVDATSDEHCQRCHSDGHYDGEPDVPCATCEGSGRVVFWNDDERVLVSSRKLPALLYVDDRALRFESWSQALDEVSARVG